MRTQFTILAAFLAAAGGWASSAAAQHHTARFAASTGRALTCERILFAPNSFYVAATDEQQLHVLHVDSGRELKTLPMQPFALAFAPKGYHLLAVAPQGGVFVPVDDRPVLNARWELPQGYLGVTFTQNAGKLLVEEMAAGGPAANSGRLQVGDEIVGVVTAGQEISVIGMEIPQLLQRLAGLAGTTATLRIVPRGSLDAQTIALRRASGVKHDNQIVFKPAATRSAPQSLVVRYEDAFVVLDAQDATAIATIQPVDIEAFGFQSFSPDGKLLALAGRRLRPQRGEPAFAVEIHDVARQQRLAYAPIEATTILAQRFSPDGRRILWALKDRILAYDVARRAMGAPILIGFDPARYAKASRPDSDVGNGLMGLADRMGGYADEAAPNEYPEQLLASFDVSPDGKMVAVGSCHGELRLFATSEHKELAKVGERTNDEVHVQPVAFSPDGKWLAYYLPGTLHWTTVASLLPK